MQRIAYWLFPLIAVAVAIFIVVFMFQINIGIPIFNNQSERDADAHNESATEESAGWLERFSMGGDKGYFYPVNELTLELDASVDAGGGESFRLTAPLKNSYELFCLKQELKKNKLPYFLKKEGDAMTVLVDSNDHAGLESLVTKLKTYQITATVSPLIEDK